LARRSSPECWEVRHDFESVLRNAQKIGDRQRTLSAGGVLRSDERFPIVSLDERAPDSIEARILVHGEEENGRTYMMLEATDAKVYVVSHTRRMQQMRSTGGLRPNTFVQLHRVTSGGIASIEIEELGAAEKILENRAYLAATAKRLARRGVIPTEDGWGGWLGRYQQAVRRAVEELVQERAPRRERKPSGISR